MNDQNISYDKWVSLSREEQKSLMQQWNPYELGYWHDLLRMAGSQFKKEWEDKPGILNITWGVFHGGHLSIVVSVGPSIGTDFSAFPSRYAGFPVVVSGNNVTQIVV